MRRRSDAAGDSWRKFDPPTTAKPPRHEFTGVGHWCDACNRHESDPVHIGIGLAISLLFWAGCACLGALLAFAVLGR